MTKYELVDDEMSFNCRGGNQETKMEVRLASDVSGLTRLNKSTNMAFQPQNGYRICLGFGSLRSFLNASITMKDMV